MGIKGLHTIIKKYVEGVYTPRHLSHYAFKKVAVDISLYMFKYKATFREKWASAFINLITVLRKNDVHCVFIFDGKAPPEKEEERKNRAADRDKLETKVFDIGQSLDRYYQTQVVDELLQKIWEENANTDKVVSLLRANAKKAFNISVVEAYYQRLKGQIISVTEDDFKLARELFDILQVPYIQAVGEAETYASQLCVRGLVDAVASEDTDVLAYGTPTFITKINTSDETCVEIDYQELISSMGLTSEQFTDLCIMCGTDYNDNMRGIGPDKSYKLLVEHGTIEDIEKIVDKKTGELKFDTSVLKYKRGREMFSTPAKIKQKIPYCGKPDIKKLQKWLFENNITFNAANILSSFERKEELVFED